jgi:hypothetical protein
LLKVDYKFARDRGNKIERFTPPDEIREIPNTIAILEAPNASGKSTLLNILALGLHANTINPAKCHISGSIRDRIQSLLDASNHELTFNFSITDPDASLEIIAEKHDGKNSEIITREISAGKKTTLTDISLPEKYFLIYDIPENPLERLPYMVDQIRSQQQDLTDRLKLLKEQAHSLLKDIKDAKNPQRIEYLQTNLHRLQEDSEKREAEIVDLQDKETTIALYQAYKFYRHYRRIRDNLEFELDKIENKKKFFNSSKKRKNTQYSNQLEIAHGHIENVRRYHTEISKYFEAIFSGSQPKEIKTAIKEWESIKPDRILETFYINENYIKSIDFFISEIRKKNQDSALKKAADAKKFYSDLLSILRSYEKSDFLFPGVDKSLTQIITDLENECKKYSHHAKVVDNYSHSLRLLTEMKAAFAALPPVLEKLRTLKGRVTEDETDDTESLEELLKRGQLRERERDEAAAALLRYKRVIGERVDVENLNYDELQEIIINYQQEHPDLSRYFFFTEDQITSDLKKIRQNIHDHHDNIKRNERIIEKESGELNVLENRPKHKYQDQYDEIENLYRHCEKLEVIIRQSLGNHLSDLAGQGKKKSPPNAAAVKVYDLIFRYLAKKIPEVPYIDEIIIPEKIDLVNRSIIDKAGGRISFDDISAGQGISLYLRSLLKLPKEDKRKIIAFFDEISTMDPKTLKYLIDDLIQLEKNDRLLCALLVQKSRKLQLKDVGEVYKDANF